MVYDIISKNENTVGDINNLFSEVPFILLRFISLLRLI